MQTVDVDLSIPGAPPIHPSPPTLARRHALHYWQINLAALDRRQSQLAGRLRQNPLHARWIYARDGSLTTLDASDRWLGGCSVPERASMQVIQRIESRGTLCLVAPPLPHLIRRMLNLSDLSELTQAMIVILPDLAAAAIALHCCDFSDAIERNRLWLAAGINWQSELSVLLRSHPGLPLPQQFTRTLVDEETAAPLIVDAQCIFTTEAERRSALLRSLRSGPRNLPPEPTCQLCLLASSRFRLWDCAGDVLHGALASGGMTVQHIDPDDPCSSGNLSLALAAARAQAVITSNSTRAELAALVPASVPIVTWMTSPAIPPFEASDACDFLLLADPSWKERAEARGWPLKQLRIAHWPSVTLETAASSPGCHSPSLQTPATSATLHGPCPSPRTGSSGS